MGEKRGNEISSFMELFFWFLIFSWNEMDFNMCEPQNMLMDFTCSKPLKLIFLIRIKTWNNNIVKRKSVMVSRLS